MVTAISSSVAGARGLLAGPSLMPVTNSTAGRIIEFGRILPFCPVVLQKRYNEDGVPFENIVAVWKRGS